MPRVAYSQADRARIRETLIALGLERMAKQGIQHTTLEEIYQAAGISRTFFYTFFPTREAFIVEVLYVQQPKILAFARSLMEQPGLSWRDGVRKFLYTCCRGEKSGIVILTIEEQQKVFRRLSLAGRRNFQEKQRQLFQGILECFGIEADNNRVNLFINLSMAAIVVRRGVPDALPLFIPEAAEEAMAVQIDAIADWLESIKEKDYR